MRVNTKQIVLSNFSGGMNCNISSRVLPINYATLSYNFDYSNGALKDGVGLKSAKFPTKQTLNVEQGVEGVYYFKRYNSGYIDQLILYCKDKNMYSYDIYNGGELKKIENLTFATKPKGITYKYDDTDVYIFSTEQEGTFLYDGENAYKVDSLPPFSDMCIHNERLFVISSGDKTRLYFSDDFNPFNFNVALDQGGYIDFTDSRGGLNKIVSSMGYLYIFRSYGISRLSSFYAQENFSVYHIFSSFGKICSDSVTPCDRGIIFLAEGLYMVKANGEIKRVLSEFDELFIGVENQGAKGLYYNGQFYLKCNINLKGQIQQALVVYDVNRNQGYISKNFSVLDFCSITGESFSLPVIVAGNGKTIYTFSKDASINNVPVTKVWETPFTDLNISKEKVLKRIEINSVNQLKFTVETNSSKKSFILNPTNGYASLNVAVRGREFRFVIENSMAGCEISNPVLTFSYV